MARRFRVLDKLCPILCVPLNFVLGMKTEDDFCEGILVHLVG